MKNMDEILARHFSGQATTEEESILQAWKAANEQEYNVLKKAWSEPYTATGRRFNADKAWERVMAELNHDKPRVFRLNSPAIKYGIAASLLLLAGAFALLRFQFNAVSEIPAMLAFENSTAAPKQVLLPDGSHVWLNQRAKLLYDRGNTDTRAMRLNGEAFFDVEKDPAHPFIISTVQGSVTVLGTSFNVNARDSVTIVSVATGLVKLAGPQAFVMLEKGQGAVARQAGVFSMAAPDVNYLSWKTGEFDFNNTPLPELVKTLNTYYKNKFGYIGKGVSACRITAHFKNNSVEEIVQMVELICGTRATYKNNQVLFQ